MIGAVLTHSSPSSTLIYTHLTAEDLRRVLSYRGVLDRVADLLSMTATPLEAIDCGRAPEGWGRLWASDRWPLREMPHSDLHSSVRAGSILFAGIPQPWFKEAAKRWARARLLARGAPSTMSHYVQHVRAFSVWLADRAPAVSSPSGITRVVLEDWMLAIRASGLAAGSKAGRVTAVRLFLEEQWQQRLAGLPRTAVIHARRGSTQPLSAAAARHPGAGVRAVHRPGEPGAVAV